MLSLLLVVLVPAERLGQPGQLVQRPSSLSVPQPLEREHVFRAEPQTFALSQAFPPLTEVWAIRELADDELNEILDRAGISGQYG